MIIICNFFESTIGDIFENDFSMVSLLVKRRSDFQELIPLHRDPSLPDPFFRDMAKTRGSGLSCSGLILCLSFNLIFLFVSCCNNFIFKGWSTYSERLEKRIASLRDNKWTQFEVDLHNEICL